MVKPHEWNTISLGVCHWLQCSKFSPSGRTTLSFTSWLLLPAAWLWGKRSWKIIFWKLECSLNVAPTTEWQSRSCVSQIYIKKMTLFLCENNCVYSSLVQRLYLYLIVLEVISDSENSCWEIPKATVIPRTLNFSFAVLMKVHKVVFFTCNGFFLH